MIEILVIFGLSVWIRTITEPKGYKWRWFVLLTIGLWFLGEIIGLFVGGVVVYFYSLRSGYVYLFALIGAAIGGAISILIAKNLEPKEGADQTIQQLKNTTVRENERCAICGYVYKLNDRFCRKCGSKLV